MTPPASPLSGKRVLVARAAGQTEGPARLLRERGAEPVVVPTIVIGPPDDEGPLRQAVGRLGEVDWVVFTSANGVERTWRALAGEGLGAAAFGGSRVAVVGSATREALTACGVTAHLLAKESRGEGVASSLIDAVRTEVRAPHVLILRAQEASEVLPDALRAAGARVDVVAAYRTRPSPEGAAEVSRLLTLGALDAVVFSSGSTVDSICDGLGPLASTCLAAVTVACIGPVTVAAAAARGVRVDVVASVPTFAAVIEALEEHFRAI